MRAVGSSRLSSGPWLWRYCRQTPTTPLPHLARVLQPLENAPTAFMRQRLSVVT
jgi:hypothetical protein